MELMNELEQHPADPRSPVRKLTPEALMPAPAALRGLDPAHVRLLAQILASPLECQFDPSFHREDAEKLYCDLPTTDRRANDDSGVNLLDSPTILPVSLERRLFLRLNYCRYRVMRTLRHSRGKSLTPSAAREVLLWHCRALETRSEIVDANVPLVLAMAKRTRIVSVDFSDLISEGNMALLRAVDKFDCSRGYKFSTYACRAILKSFSRSAVRASRYRGHFPTEFDPNLERGHDAEKRQEDLELDCIDQLKAILGSNSAHLNDVEQQVIRARFALDQAADENARPQTLEQVGALIGVTKERVRQIQNKALSKLRMVLESSVLVA
ncbi:MAG: RNA polymerase sigma factor RpoD [Phycisphaerae bacterium]|nr:RNA polymerase sigma factor RpoD [Phycisphaerae bacterium]